MERNEGYLINGIIHVPDVYEEHHADARLIAAAPQMYEALEQAATLIYQYHNIGALLGSDHGLCPEYEDCKLCTTVRSLRSVLRAARGQEAN